ncbi:EAL domain-containing protein [Rhizobium sp. TRM96647]|uniref:putative bifunctional diguanylate cyclase/phosphodiesterase n=1 Tax=unclassified Rhizobium TaxID=2613769 RepID=UPI0021E8D60B|nr:MULTISPECIES: EAL domain-containing protein [unclassified Rhizobium]MCV3737986.1 EAL domain-containing protein [Rhizobium sp. TRM96647]MCV3759673.1 EAL domain-containing protein [Rhizobium sp. TRM96650]
MLVCQAALPVGVVVTALWMPIFAFVGDWFLVLLVGFLLLVMAACWEAARRGYFSAGYIAAQFASGIFVVYFSLLYDVPSEAVPRVCHLYFLVIALAGYANFGRDRGVLQLVVILLCLFGFVVFASSPMAFSFAAPLPEAVRAVTAWINVASVAILLAGGVVLLQREFTLDGNTARELRSALADSQFELFYQPQVDQAGTVIGAEALLRWKHPKRGYVPPDEFVPAAERAGLMPRLGSWVLKEAAQTLSAWRAHPATRDLVLSINVSADQFRMADFVPLVTETIEAYGIEPAVLKLELTESVFVADIDDVVTKMKALERAGIGIALDDFGTGYSSLSHLRQLPLQQLKIDRSFVRAVTESGRGASLARNIAKMGHDLSLEILAEGIETEEQFQFMLSCGCRKFQGYHFGRPVPLAALEERIAAPAQALVG